MLTVVTLIQIFCVHDTFRGISNVYGVGGLSNLLIFLIFRSHPWFPSMLVCPFSGPYLRGWLFFRACLLRPELFFWGRRPETDVRGRQRRRCTDIVLGVGYLSCAQEMTTVRTIPHLIPPLRWNTCLQTRCFVAFGTCPHSLQLGRLHAWRSREEGNGFRADRRHPGLQDAKSVEGWR